MNKIKPLRKYIIFSACFFILACIAGYFFAETNPHWAKMAMERITEEFQNLIHPNPWIQFMIIFYHNALASFLVIASFFLFGSSALFAIFSNGLIIGIVLNVYLKSNGLIPVLILLAPHGIIELPTFFLSCATGLWLGFKFARNFSPKYKFKEHFLSAFKLFFFLIVPLLFVAALIESFITPWLYKLSV